ncbi:MAG: hypothetical protein ACFFDP_00300, partial [Promethearchaeota archaeon]
MTRYRKASDGQWPGYPHLQLEDVETETIQQNRYVAASLVNNRKGRIVLLMDKDFFQKFLDAVNKRKGDISARHVNEAAV